MTHQIESFLRKFSPDQTPPLTPEQRSVQALVRDVEKAFATHASKKRADGSISLVGFKPEEKIIRGETFYTSEGVCISYQKEETGKEQKWTIGFIQTYSETSSGHEFADVTYEYATMILSSDAKNLSAIIRIQEQSEADEQGAADFSVFSSGTQQMTRYEGKLREILNFHAFHSN